MTMEFGKGRGFVKLSALLFFIVLASGAAHAFDVPAYGGRVTDLAGILSPAARQGLEAVIASHERATTNQIAVLTLKNLGGATPEEAALEVFNTWKLGQRERDNGVLVLVAAEERRMRIEVGYGLEGTLTDLVAGRIIRDTITPRFKNSDYEGGLATGVAAIIGVLEKGGLPEGGWTPEEAAPARVGKSGGFTEDGADMPILMRIVFGVFSFSIIGIFTFLGVVQPGFTGWFLYFFLIPFWAGFPTAILGARTGLSLLGVYLVAYPIAKWRVRKSAWGAKAAESFKTKGHFAVGGMVIGSSGGSVSGGGGSGGGSGGGGGGGSGGGGAGGGW